MAEQVKKELLQKAVVKKTPAKKIVEQKEKKYSNKNNPMKSVSLEKVIAHICTGETGPKLDKAKQILQILTNRKPVETKAKVKLPKWGLHPGLPIGVKVTLRNKDADAFLKKTLESRSFALNKKSIDDAGNFAFGIPEYIDIKGMKYDPKIGIFGFDVIVSLKRNGFRVKYRHLKRKNLNKNLRITKAETEDFLIKNYNVKFN
ncbi:MAG: 50S ribosomal protein L5 [Candidatus Diapherotrites archaeon CG08_land_8_20_14_0_20_30_16]|nr:MAG: 50S ribosomal protein L5 [Candidatus Diapherotrites archaeon CG08_land_8_20_14_0_20_30_16]